MKASQWRQNYGAARSMLAQVHGERPQFPASGEASATLLDGGSLSVVKSIDEKDVPAFVAWLIDTWDVPVVKVTPSGVVR